MGELIGLPFCIATGIVWVFSIVCVGFYSFDEITLCAERYSPSSNNKWNYWGMLSCDIF